MKVLAVIPAHNEAATLPWVVAELRRVRPDLDVLVIDDGSQDGSAAVAKGLGVWTCELEAHSGIGAAMRAGLQYAARHGYDAVVRLDADGQHPATAIQGLLDALAAGHHAAVGSRFHPASRFGMPVSRRLLHRALAWALSLSTSRDVTDPTSGFWAFDARAIALLADRHPDGYAEPQLYLLLHHSALRLAEVPVHMRHRLAGSTSLTATRILRAAAATVFALGVAAFSGPAAAGTPASATASKELSS